MRVSDEVGRLRRRKAYQAVRAALLAIVGRTGFRVVHLSIQRHHIHLLCEADDRAALANGVRALCISAAKRLNRAVTIAGGTPRTGRPAARKPRTGRVFTDRYHATSIATPRQARPALANGLNNWRRHREDQAAGGPHRAPVDRYSSGAAFAGWRERGVIAGVRSTDPDPTQAFQPMPTAAARTWLLRVGWKRGGPAPSLWEVPPPLTE
jgi:REP element-mobilizing transposase RayT